MSNFVLPTLDDWIDLGLGKAFWLPVGYYKFRCFEYACTTAAGNSAKYMLLGYYRRGQLEDRSQFMVIGEFTDKDKIEHAVTILVIHGGELDNRSSGWSDGSEIFR